MSVALFDEPPRVSFPYPDLVGGSRVGLLLGFADGAELEGVLCLEDGSVTLLPVGNFLLSWRYEAETDRWVDVTAR